MHILDTFHRLSLRLLEGLVIALMAVLVLDVSWQVITRYLLGSPSAWTDELATILMIWVAALGASLGFIQKAHLGIDVIQVQVDVVAFRPDPAPFAHFQRHRAADDVAAGEVFVLGGVTLHKALTF